MGTRTKLINHVRGAVKSMGARIPKCAAEVFHTRAVMHVLSSLRPALQPVLQTIAGLTRTLRAYERTLVAPLPGPVSGHGAVDPDKGGRSGDGVGFRVSVGGSAR